jgi:hypothetical protein
MTEEKKNKLIQIKAITVPIEFFFNKDLIVYRELRAKLRMSFSLVEDPYPKLSPAMR